MTESYLNHTSGKRYFHWLERAQLGQLECAVIKWPTLFQDNLFKNLIHETEHLQKHLIPLVKPKSYSYTENKNSSVLFNLAEGHKYVPNQSFLRDLSQTVSLYLKNETKLNIADLTQIEMNPSFPREINPLYIEKKYEARLAKENPKLINFAHCLGAATHNQNELMFSYVIFEMLENLIILKDKFPEFKIYLILPFTRLEPLGLDSQFDYAIEINNFQAAESAQKSYYLKSLKEEAPPYLGEMLLSDHLEQSELERETTLSLNHSSYDYDTKVLSLAPEIPAGKNKMALENVFVDLEKTDLGLKAKGHSKIRLLTDFFRKDNNLLFKHEVIDRVKYGVSYENASGLESFSSSLSFWSEFEYEYKKYRVHNFQHTQELMFRFIGEGLSFFSDLDRKDLATFRKGSKRDHDLKILKHQGVAALITLEACYHTLNEPLTTGEIDLTDEETALIIERNIFNLFKKSIFVDKYGEAFVNRTHLKDYISDKVYEFLIETIQVVISSLKFDHRYLSLQGQILKLSGYSRFSCQSLLTYIEPIMNATRGEVFTKGNSKYFEPLAEYTLTHDSFEPVFMETSVESELKNQHVFKSRVSDFVIPFVYSKLTELSGLEWDVYIDSIPIEKLNEEDFQSELVLQNGKTDWFELSPKLFFKGVAVRIEDIKFSNATAGSKTGNGIIFYKGRPYIIDPKSLPKYSLLEKFWERIKKEATLSGATGKEREFVRVPRSSILELLSLAESGTKIITDNPYWNEIYNFYKNIGSPQNKLDLPERLQKILKDYQIIGTQWIYDLYRLHLGGILADDMGLGKTLQVLTFLNQHKAEGHKTWSLVVVPTSLCFNWENEAKKFTPNLEVEVFSAAKKKHFVEAERENHKIIIVTYGLLIEHEDFFGENLWDIVVFDEAQNLKNLSSRRTSSARSLKAKFKLALSGTPLENNYLDFFSLADLVLPGSLGSYKSFNEVFGIGKSIESEDLIHLRQKMKPIVLRRTKSSVNLNLPTKTEESYHLDFTEEQIELYRKLALTHNEQVTQLIKDNGAAGSQIAMLTALLRLRQVCSDPNGIPNVKFNDVPPKLSYITDCVTEHLENGRSVLVFTQFLATLDNLSKMFVKNNIPFFTIHGAVSSKNRAVVLDQFQNSETPQVLLMTLKTGGVGLNLTKASVVYHIEPWWNPAVENQATDRVHRLGQQNDISVYRLIMKDSVEEKIELLKLRKKAYFDSLFSNEESTSASVDSNGNSTNYLSAEDFKFLLS
ncbi:MAG: DEAD/DEAH box helicase [Moraxellaceae bacterium]|nr:DEAD/DEAH box helicase [Pseudobdellovibrionaceae bacterium]